QCRLCRPHPCCRRSVERDDQRALAMAMAQWHSHRAFYRLWEALALSRRAFFRNLSTPQKPNTVRLSADPGDPSSPTLASGHQSPGLPPEVLAGFDARISIRADFARLFRKRDSA